MKINSDNSALNILKICGVLAIIIVIVGILALSPRIFSSHEMLFQILAVVLSVLFTAVVTSYLLISQSQSEENKEKNIKIHENKIKAYSSFLQKMWGVLDDDTIFKEEINDIRADLLDNLIFYLDKSQLQVILEALNNLYDGLKEDKPDESKKSEYIKFATSVANNLKEVVSTSVQKNRETDTELILNLWTVFSNIENQFPDKEEIGEPEVASEVWGQPEVDHFDESNSSPSIITKRLKAQAWHFCELSTSQLDYLESGGTELSLVEYGVNWRTDLVKQVKPNDIVFLFRGNKRYSGAFLAKGWRVFIYDEQRNVLELTSPDVEKKVVKEGKVSIDSVASVLAKYDIYQSYLDPNSTSCANIIVDELSYFRDGVTNPNTTYRKTISRYYWEYAVKLMKEFVNKETDQSKKDRIASLFE